MSPSALLRYLTRLPDAEEKAAFTELLAPGFETRLATAKPDFQKLDYNPEVREVSWINHLSVAANEFSSAIETRAHEGPRDGICALI